jgi:glyoxylase I family protein
MALQTVRYWLYCGKEEASVFAEQKEEFMFKKIDHVEITPSNLDTTIRFYTEIFGFTVKMRKKIDSPPMEEVCFLELGGTVLELVAMRDPVPPSKVPQVGYRAMAIEVEDMDKAVEYLKGKGVEISTPPVSLGTSKRGEIKDPDGLVIELRQW